MNGFYKVFVSREGKWWLIRVPEIDQVTQARNWEEIEDDAKDLIAITLDVDSSEVFVEITWKSNRDR